MVWDESSYQASYQVSKQRRKAKSPWMDIVGFGLSILQLARFEDSDNMVKKVQSYTYWQVAAHY